MISRPSIVSRVNPFLFLANQQIRFANYHNVYDDKAENRDSGISSSMLHKQIQWLLRNGFTFISGREALEIAKSGKKAYRKIVFTTDDAHIDNWNVMSPIFDNYSIKPILFINSGNIGSADYMSREQIAHLIAKGYEIGSHTVSHINCADMDSDTFEDEILSDIENLKEWFGESIKYFAFPYGKVFADVKYIDKLKEAGVEMTLSVRYMLRNNLSPLSWGRDKGEMSYRKFLFMFHVRPYIMLFANTLKKFDNRV